MADVLYDDGDLGQAGHFGGPQAAFAGHQLVADAILAHEQRLNDALGADGGGQIRHVLFGKMAPRLVAVGFDKVHIAKEVVAGALGWRFHPGDKRFQSLAQRHLLAFAACRFV